MNRSRWFLEQRLCNYVTKFGYPQNSFHLDLEKKTKMTNSSFAKNENGQNNSKSALISAGRYPQQNIYATVRLKL